MKRIVLITALGCCCFHAQSQNLIDNYLTGTPTYTVIANASNQVNQPRDLDFKPLTNELWIINRGSSSGGSNVIIYNAGQSNQSSQFRMDTHSGHFMIYPAGIAFGDDGEFATVNEIKNTASASSTFMGPALWTADTSIFARVFQNNWVNGKPLGSHLDMLHQSPFAMGVAHDSGSMYWVFDGHNGNLCKYDFGKDHSPGYDDHSNGKIWRYTDVPLTRAANIPGHMIKDKATGWLYIIDAGTKKLKRVNTNTGAIAGTLSVPGTAGEPLVGYWSFTGATVEELDSFLTAQPCGVDLYNGRLIVGDNSNGDIHVYDITGTSPVKLGVIATGQAGMMGVKIGSDGKIWFVNYTQNTVMRIDPSAVVNDDVAVVAITAPLLNNFEAHFYHSGFNECGTSITPAITIQNAGANTLTSATINYTIDNGTVNTYSWTGSLAPGATAPVSLPGITVTSGGHKLIVEAVSPNGTADLNPANNAKMGSFRAFAGTAAFPLTQSFTSPTFPPTDWTYIAHNFNNEFTHNASVGASNAGSVKMDNFNGAEDITGQRDYLITPRIDFTNASANANVSFAVAHAQYNTSSNDALTVRVSTDCGDTWTQVYHKSGAALSTANPITSAYTPTASEWRTESASLSAFIGQPEVMIQFLTTSGYGNNLYLDDINISNTLGVETPMATVYSIYPNPATDKLTIKSAEQFAGDVKVTMYDMAGKVIVNAQGYKGADMIDIDVRNLASGTYLVRVRVGSESMQQKVTVTH